jgi:hypothetical protein
VSLAAQRRGTSREVEGSRSTTSRVSLMPKRLLESLTAQEAADILEFVITFK